MNIVTKIISALTGENGRKESAAEVCTTKNGSEKAAESSNICCFCGKSIKREEIQHLPKPGSEQRPDPFWFYCRSCGKIAEQDVTALKNYEGYNPYAYKRIEEELEQKKKESLRQAVLPFAHLMTSQLAARWLDTKEDKYKAEHCRRMSLCGLDAEKAEQMLTYECGILKSFPRPEMLRDDFVKIPVFGLKKTFLEHPLEYYQTNFEYPLSYIVKISDEAEWHFHYSHEKELTDEVWSEIFQISDKNMALFRPFAMNLVEQVGWTIQQINKFSFYEQKILDVYRWHYRQADTWM